MRLLELFVEDAQNFLGVFSERIDISHLWDAFFPPVNLKTCR